jgi:hypothetical protein
VVSEFDRSGIAARVRGLIGGQNGGDVGAIARRLHVDEVSLRMTIDEVAPYPTLDALAAIVDHYGVDPNWLLTGEYDATTHREALLTAAEQNRQALGKLLQFNTPAQSLRMVG